jgi:hypothetical protein
MTSELNDQRGCLHPVPENALASTVRVFDNLARPVHILGKQVARHLAPAVGPEKHVPGAFMVIAVAKLLYQVFHRTRSLPYQIQVEARALKFTRIHNPPFGFLFHV